MTSKDARNEKRRLRTAMLGRYKVFKGCVDCGYNQYPEALDFDHIKGEKVRAVGSMAATASLSKIFAEIEKCEVVCANCHRHRTRERRR